MNNTDFQRLLLTNDKALVTELTKSKRASSAAGGGEKKKRERPAKGKGKGGKDGGADGESKGKGKGAAAAKPSGGQAPTGPQYRDRAKERREEKGEYETVAQEFESHAEVSIDQSKYLGGDLDHTHLVKGLDFALLSKVRTEMTKQQKVEGIQKERAEKKAGAQKKKGFETLLGRRVYQALVETLHPHHATFKKRVQNMSKAIALGQRIRGAPSTFLPGRMAYEFDTGMSAGSGDIPRTVFASKEDAPRVNNSRRAAPILPETVTLVRDVLHKIVEERKQRKRDRAAGGTTEASSYTVAQKVVPKVKAKDADEDIFGGVAKFDPAELARSVKSASRSSSKAKADAHSKSSSKSSYFADAGSEKYLRAPEGQLELDEVETEDQQTKDGDAAAAADEASVEFEAADRFAGPRPGWAFKTGKRGLGYYREASASKGSASGATKKRKRGAASVPADDDAYDECFPDSNLGYAAVDTGEGDSDEEGNDVKSKIERLKKLAGKSDKPDSMSANRKEGASNKKHMSEAQQWQKIDHMIKKGKHSSLEALESQSSGKRRAPMPREIMSTPVHF